MGKFRDRLIAEGSFNREWDIKDVNQHTEYMERETIIRISRRGPEGSWHNVHIGIEFHGVLGESETEFKLKMHDGEFWIDKHYVDVRHSSNESWISGDKYRSARKEEATRPISPEEDAILRNPLLMSMTETFQSCLFTAVAKNNDYGGSNNDPFANFRNSTIAGVTVEKGILVRLMDKMSRVSTLLDKEAMVKDEAITDTIEDAINYLAIMKAYIDLKNKK